MNCELSCDVENLDKHSQTSSEESNNSQISHLPENPAKYSLIVSRSEFICNLCNKSFRKERFLNYHIKRHVGNKPHVCNICSKSFIKTGDLKRHMFTHSGEKPYVCNTCNKSFNRKGILKTHLLTHSGEKSHICIICNKSFALKAHLQRHELIHTGEKPYVCNICSMAFGRQSHLKRHFLIHSGKNNKKNSTYDEGEELPSTSKKNKNINSDSHLAKTNENTDEIDHPEKLQAIEEIYYIVKEEQDISDEENENLGVGEMLIKSDDIRQMSCDIKEENSHDGMNNIVKEEHDIDYEEVVY